MKESGQRVPHSHPHLKTPAGKRTKSISQVRTKKEKWPWEKRKMVWKARMLLNGQLQTPHWPRKSQLHTQRNNQLRFTATALGTTVPRKLAQFSSGHLLQKEGKPHGCVCRQRHNSDPLPCSRKTPGASPAPALGTVLRESWSTAARRRAMKSPDAAANTVRKRKAAVMLQWPFTYLSKKGREHFITVIVAAQLKIIIKKRIHWSKGDLVYVLG